VTTRKLARYKMIEWEDRGYRCEEWYLGGILRLEVYAPGQAWPAYKTHIPDSGTGRDYTSAIIDGLIAGESSSAITQRVMRLGQNYSTWQQKNPGQCARCSVKLASYDPTLPPICDRCIQVQAGDLCWCGDPESKHVEPAGLDSDGVFKPLNSCSCGCTKFKSEVRGGPEG
jgi:hypothetical protein